MQKKQTQGKKNAWTDEEKALVMEAVSEFQERGETVSEALRFAHTLLPHRTIKSVSNTYYVQMREQAKGNVEKVQEGPNNEAIQGLQELVAYVQSLQEDNRILREELKQAQLEVARLQQMQKDYEDLSRILQAARAQVMYVETEPRTYRIDPSTNSVELK